MRFPLHEYLLISFILLIQCNPFLRFTMNLSLSSPCNESSSADITANTNLCKNVVGIFVFACSWRVEPCPLAQQLLPIGIDGCRSWPLGNPSIPDKPLPPASWRVTTGCYLWSQWCRRRRWAASTWWAGNRRAERSGVIILARSLWKQNKTIFAQTGSCVFPNDWTHAEPICDAFQHVRSHCKQMHTCM